MANIKGRRRSTNVDNRMHEVGDLAAEANYQRALKNKVDMLAELNDFIMGRVDPNAPRAPKPPERRVDAAQTVKIRKALGQSNVNLAHPTVLEPYHPLPKRKPRRH